MAKVSTWKMLYPLFKPKNLGKGAYENMQDDFLLSLYKFRVAMDNPMIVHVGYATSGHSRNSFHYQGRAIDFHFKYNPVPTRKIIVTAINKAGRYTYTFPEKIPESLEEWYEIL
jgi:hypothetical protein